VSPDIYKLLRITRYTGFWHYDVKSVKGDNDYVKEISGEKAMGSGHKKTAFSVCSAAIR
jgi:hypothetical protein